MKYYDFEPLWNTDADIMMAISQRGIGKTYSGLIKCLIRYRDNKYRFAYVRRWAEDTKRSLMLTLFSRIPVEEIFGENFSIMYESGRFILCYTDKSGETEKIDEIGYVFAINNSHHTKSASFKDVKTILFDEFVAAEGENYVDNEVHIFENLVSTLVRTDDDVKIMMFANTVGMLSPWFNRYGINITKIEQGTLITNTFDTGGETLVVAFEYCEFNKDVAAKTSKWSSSKMIAKGEWEIRDTSDIPEIKGEVIRERLLFSAYIDDLNTNIGCFVRTGTYITKEFKNYKYVDRKHVRQFLVIRETDKVSHYYHLTKDKDLSYSNWVDFNAMLRDIKENVDLDVWNEIKMNRVYCDNKFTADYFYKTIGIYTNVSTYELL